ncbi:MAG TPA: isoamylase early set domain-containing protein [Candidatus Binatia bacterium]|jgi:1,4-alpha-glucan branching enzyme|nr:isoamylase early set domain-containing protein [Candidatus Binatia bacterium]
MLKKRFFKTIDECEVTFRTDPQEAESVALVIESNGWEPIPMEQLKSGPFKATLRLPLNSRVQFRYLVDGDNWQNDDAADAYVPNQFGEANSVVETFRNGF